MVFLYPCFLLLGAIPALRYTLFCPAAFSMGYKELLAVALEVHEKPTAVLLQEFC
jgi:hypothetical protein